MQNNKTRPAVTGSSVPDCDASSREAAHPSERPAFLVAVGLIGMFGCAVLLFGSFLGSVLVPDYSWVSDTISDLAAGPNELVMDLSLYGFAGALVAAALGASHLHLGRIGWTLGIFALVLTAATTIIIGARNEYGDSDSGGVVIHIYLVCLLGILFAAGPFLMAPGAGLISRGYRRAFKALGALWLVAAPVFFVVPTSWGGLYERGLGIVAVAWIGLLSSIFISTGRAAR